jgi:pimeloyl-ACP methyl ester carboxylesterase
LVGKAMVVDMLPQPAGLVGADTAGVRPLADMLAGLASTEDGQALVGAFAGMFGGPAPADRRSDNRVVARATHELALLDLTHEVARIKAPLTVVYAGIEGADRIYPAAYARKRDARLVRVANSGHAVMLDQPEAFRKAVRDFLEN